MQTFLASVYLYCVSIWVGGIFFFTTIGAPSAFKVFKKKDAGMYTNFVFPKYFGLGYILGISCLVSLFFLVRQHLSVLSSFSLLILVIMNLLNILNGMFIVPKAEKLKFSYYEKAEEKVYDRFLSYHKVSMVLNAINVFLGLLLIGITSMYLDF